MSKKYFSIQFFLLLTTLMAMRTLAEKNWLQHKNDLPSGFAMVDNDDDGGGEICDPNKSNACESPTAKCEWKQLDMLYKCTEPPKKPKKRLVKRKKFKSDDQKDGSRKRMVKGFECPNTHRIGNMNTDSFVLKPPLSSNQQGSLDSSTEVNGVKGTSMLNNETVTDQFSRVTTQSQTEGRKQQIIPLEKSQPTTESRGKGLVAEPAPFIPNPRIEEHGVEIPNTRGGEHGVEIPNTRIGEHGAEILNTRKGGQVVETSEVRVGDLNKKKEGTYNVPKYSGELTWDGQTVFSEACILKSTMAEALEEKKNMESKEEWAKENAGQICNFKKFFHCTIEQADSELILEDGDEEELPTEPVCRCYESAMPVVNGMCYIPADFGAKSQCGDHVTAPYPVKPWNRAPPLKPRCTPNSDCKESQYWFGKRCTCRYNARWNPQTHTCDKGTKSTLSLGLLFVSYTLISLQSWKE